GAGRRRGARLWVASLPGWRLARVGLGPDEGRRLAHFPAGGIRSDFCWLWCWLAEVCLLLVGLTRPGTKKRKRTKKGAVKAGRKKSKKDAPSAPEITTPRTRAVAAREAANAAIAAAKEAEALAIAAANEAEASASNQAPTLSTKRRLALEEDPPTLEALLPAPAKKMTPRKKQLATKVKKATKSKSPAKK
ncbi:unnamed protein product, partial [Urochloa humidicola]